MRKAEVLSTTMTSFIGPQITLHLDYMEGELGKSTWFAGDEFTAADIQMSFPLEAAAARGGLGAVAVAADARVARARRFVRRTHEQRARAARAGMGTFDDGLDGHAGAA